MGVLHPACYSRSKAAGHDTERAAAVPPSYEQYEAAETSRIGDGTLPFFVLLALTWANTRSRGDED